MTSYPLSVLRTVALHTQALDTADGFTPNRDSIYKIVDQIGCIQIDTLQMVRRSHYLVLWSRLGNYSPSDFDALTSADDRRLFEGWQHAASIIPLSDYRCRFDTMYFCNGGGWWHGWMDDPEGWA